MVRQVFTWHVDEGLSLRRIGRRRQEAGIPAPKGGALWSAREVGVILGNSAYSGTWIVNRTRTVDGRKVARPQEEWIPLSVPAIIDGETFARSQQQHRENERFSPRHLTAERWLLRGVIRSPFVTTQP